MTADGYSHLVGHRFRGGIYELAEYVSWLWEDAIGAEHEGGLAHPSLGYYVAMSGLGASIGEVMALLEATPDSGVMFGESELEFQDGLRAGATYECEAEITGVERKEGRRAGVFDRLTFRVLVRERGGSAIAVVCTNTWIFPRREGSGG
jgi:N-terminal half of MaoC dehydratase